ncbi:CTP synthase [Candidatus Mycoplasma haematohominis]|uniref:CTP synthase n=1 Tax=Candidatus Mycoplasma haematohominis TaxID=1494318 RepID=UPI001C0A688C|nr:CTP synthase [Candidatus Mycoplasma haemohominis]
MKTNVIFLIGGVYSSVGKGLTLASIGSILQELGFSVSIIKFDPYLNINAGQLCPTEHGEIYVTSDGHEADLDIGHYERLLCKEIHKNSCLTTSLVYKKIIEKQNSEDFFGRTIQINPHFIDEIHNFIHQHIEQENNPDFLLIELGGTVGDAESKHFLEAIQSFEKKYGKKHVLFIHISPLIYLEVPKEFKTKPAQHSIKELAKYCISPDILILRSHLPPPKTIKTKLSKITHLPEEDIITCKDSRHLYLVPENLYKQKIHERILKKLNLEPRKNTFEKWNEFTKKITNPKNKKLNVSIIGEHSSVLDSYLSITESLKFASYELGVDLEIDYLNPEEIKDINVLNKYGAICAPYDLNTKETNKKLSVIEFCRKNNVPFLGINQGMHFAFSEFMKNVIQKDKPDISIPLFLSLPNTRLGKTEIEVKTNTLAHKIFKKEKIEFRERHKYYLNPELQKILQNTDLVISATSIENPNIAEIIELKNHAFFIASQFHSEFNTNIHKVVPIFVEFIKAGINHII